MVRSSGHCRPRSASSCVRPVWIRGVVLGFILAACLQICGAQSTGVADAIVEAPEYLKQTDHCCQVPVFGNENIAPELYECKGICEAMVPYTTPQACTMNHTCIFALAAYNAAYDLALTRLSEARVCDTDQRVCGPGVGCLGGTCRNPPNDMSVSCELTLRRAMCAYHFPRCVFDQLIISHEICMELCDEVVTFCNISLDEVVPVPKCTDRNFGCIGSTAPPRHTRGSMLLTAVLVPLALVVGYHS